MKIIWSWLKEYLPDLKATAHEVAALLNLSSFEVESVEKVGGISGVVVGEVKSCEKHPNADKLSVCMVSVAEVQPLQIICGASNVKTGQKVPVALVGAILPGDFKIEEREIRGIKSFGMICSEKELGLAEESAGIMVLPKTAKVGEPFAGGEEDWIIDLNVLPNRPDALGHIGIAREVSALYNIEIRNPCLAGRQAKIETNSKSEIRNYKLKISIKDKTLCKRYVGILINGIAVKPSPVWMQKRLEAAGIRPINNIVDITNYVMLEYGQPLHAFDAGKISGKEIDVRLARAGEKITTIDGIDRKLSKEMLVIADKKNPIAIAGVMGGAESEISEKTQEIILESANFDPISIRKTSKALNLRSESSLRFERGPDAQTTLLAAQRAAQLIAELAGGKILSFSDFQSPQIPKIPKIPQILISQERIKSFLGIDISPQTTLTTLTSLIFSVEKGKGDWVVIPPHFRQDIKEESDVMEEIARIYGYANFPAKLPAGEFVPPQFSSLQKVVNEAKKVFWAGGFVELHTFSFMSQHNIDRFGFAKERAVEIANPISSEYQFMRTSLLPAITSALAENQVEESLRIFEIASVYEKRAKGYSEPVVLAGAVIGAFPNCPNPPNYPNVSEFFQAKGVLENLAAELGIKISFKEKKEKNFHPGRCASIIAKGDEIGIVGELHPALLAELNIKKRVAVFEIGVEALADLAIEGAYKPVSKYPEARFDLSLLAPKEILADQIQQTIMGAADLVKSAELFDYYEGKGIGENQKSLAYHIVLQSFDYTLSEEEIKKAREAILNELKKLGVTLRV